MAGVFDQLMTVPSGTWVPTGEITNGDGHYYSTCLCSTCGRTGHIVCRKDGRMRSAMCQKCRLLVHGASGTPTHNSWKGMIGRTSRPSDKNYARYGGRGITVCERWQSFENFLADMGPRPPGTSIDRIDNDGDYEPSNCRWVDDTTQANNTSATRRIEFRGETLSLSAWARRIGVSPATMHHRLSHFTLEKSLTTPPNEMR